MGFLEFRKMAQVGGESSFGQAYWVGARSVRAAEDWKDAGLKGVWLLGREDIILQGWPVALTNLLQPCLDKKMTAPRGTDSEKIAGPSSG